MTREVVCLHNHRVSEECTRADRPERTQACQEQRCGDKDNGDEDSDSEDIESIRVVEEEEDDYEMNEADEGRLSLEKYLKLIPSNSSHIYRGNN